jgi:hypothetical protein
LKNFVHDRPVFDWQGGTCVYPGGITQRGKVPKHNLRRLGLSCPRLPAD